MWDYTTGKRDLIQDHMLQNYTCIFLLLVLMLCCFQESNSRQYINQTHILQMNNSDRCSGKVSKWDYLLLRQNHTYFQKYNYNESRYKFYFNLQCCMTSIGSWILQNKWCKKGGKEGKIFLLMNHTSLSYTNIGFENQVSMLCCMIMTNSSLNSLRMWLMYN